MFHYPTVLLPQSLKKPLTYKTKEDICIGTFVEVPIRHKHSIGVVWSLHNKPPTTLKEEQIKSIAKILPFTPLSLEYLKFLTWSSHYYMTPLGLVLKTALSSALKKETRPTHILWEGQKPSIMTKSRARLLAHLPVDTAIPIHRLKEKSHLIAPLIKAGILKRLSPPLSAHKPKKFRINPTRSQQNFLQHAYEKIHNAAFSPLVLSGAPGTGKSTIGAPLIEKILNHGKQALVLLPEIALTTRWRGLLRDTLNIDPYLWHTHQKPSEKKAIWTALQQATPCVVVGARSAVFLPFHTLGGLIIDEEHDTSFKQDEGLRYHGRDMALMRGKQHSCPVILISATPSMETLYNIEHKGWSLTTLEEKERPRPLPPINLVDMRTTSNHTFLSDPLKKAIEKALKQGHQSLLYLNRRGYANCRICTTCSDILLCDQCSSFLVHHLKEKVLKCHLCHSTFPLSKTCPCGKGKGFRSYGPGIERLEETVRTLFPKACIEKISSDTILKAGQKETLIQNMSQGKIDILIGTQIISKGHHFPHLTVVGVIDADFHSLAGEFRTAEATWQILEQVAGRGGRKYPGEVFLQTHTPNNPLLQYLCTRNQQGYIAHEKYLRKTYSLPPFGSLASLIISGLHEEKTAHIVRQIGSLIPQVKNQDVTILGPSPAVHFRIRGAYRWRFSIRTPKHIRPQKLISLWLSACQKKHLLRSVKVEIDIDPYAFF